MWRKTSSIVISFIVIAISGNLALAACPSADLTGDCTVDFNDFALMADQWLGTAPDIPGFVVIPDGVFEMGDYFYEGDPQELPLHTVMVDSIYMGEYEITNQQYCDYLNSVESQGLITVSAGVVYKVGSGTAYCDTHSANSYSQIEYSGGVFSVRTKSGRDMSNDPMVQVTWYGAASYCNWRSQEEGKEQCYNFSTWNCDFSKKGYRLATEAEWEYAARGGISDRRFVWGYSINHDHANYIANGSAYAYDTSPYTTDTHHPDWDDGDMPYTSVVGSFPENGYGLYDMAGNVWEWCHDWYSSSYYSSSPYNNPTGLVSSPDRAFRGGAWSGNASDCRISRRNDVDPSYRAYSVGFRIVLDD